MVSLRWILLSALAVAVVHAAPRELSSEELITEPRPGEEYVNIQTNSQDKYNLEEHSFTTSHRIPEKKGTFETSHKVPTVEVQPRDPRETEQFATAETKYSPVQFGQAADETSSTEAVQVVTRTSVKMSKSKKVQKVKVPQDVQIEIKSSEGAIDETATADEDVKMVMAKKHLAEGYDEEEYNISKSKGKAAAEEKKPLRFNVPFEDEVEVTGKPMLLSVGPAQVSTLKTTEDPPITTFNYKNIYNLTKTTPAPAKEIIEVAGGKIEKLNPDKYKYEVITSESIKTAESRTQTAKKDTKQEKKVRLPKKDEEIKRQDTGFYVLPVNKPSSQVSDDNFDFVDLDEKVLETAGSSPGQSSRINVKKGPNGQEYEYVYYYYYYDDDDDGKGNGTGGAGGAGRVKEEKGQVSSTEKVYNGHDGPALESYHEKEEAKSSTSGARYLPTESPQKTQKSRKKTTQQTEVEEAPEVVSERTRYSSINRQAEPANNEILPVTSRPSSRFRGRSSSGGQAQAQSSSSAPPPPEDIPSIGEERLPANTRFPPRSRGSGGPTSPQPQETTSRTRNRESVPQNRVRLPNLGLLDSSSFRTHSSDASIDEDPIHEAELQRRPASRTQHTTEAADLKRDEITTLSHRRGRPTTASTTTTAVVTDEPELPPQQPSRRPVSRRPVIEGEAAAPPPRLQVPFEQEEAPEEEEVVEKITGNGRRPETTRESDAEEGDFPAITRTPIAEDTGSGEVKATEITTEDESAVGLTSAMMEKVALDLYAILQQAQDENIQTNFVDGTATEPITTEDEQYTEATTVSTTTTTTTTTEPPTTTTTTTPAPTAPAGRGRYRTRGGAGGGLAKTRAKASTTTTTEAAVEPTSQRTRGRFQPHGNRAQGGSRRVTQKPKVEVEEEVVPKEEAPKQSSERAFGGRNRFRGGVKPATTTSTTAAPATISGAAAISGSRGAGIDRFNARRRGGSRVAISTTAQPTAEDNLEGEQPHQETAVSVSDEATATTAGLKPGARNRIHIGGARPLRPGPRVPLNLAHRGRLPSTTALPQIEAEEPVVEKEVAEVEQPAQPEEVPEPVATPAPDALSRLKNRRLRIGPAGAQPRPTPQSAVTPPANRKKLVSSLLPKRGRPGEIVEKQEEAVAVVEERHEDASAAGTYEEDASQVPIEVSSTTEAGLPGLLNGRRRNLIRRPGTLYSRSQQQQQVETAAA